MAGLLDYGAEPAVGLLGNLFNDPGARLGMSLLAASSPRLRGLADVMASQDRAQQQALQQKYLQSQIDENATQNKQREMQMQNAMAQQARENSFFGIGGVQPTTQGAGMIPASSGGAVPSGDKFDEWSRQYGIPKDALMVDYLKNGGKGIAEMIAKRGTPDMQVTNGYAYDRNKLGAGFMPSLTTSQDGKSTMTRIGPDGLPVVSAPQGALATYGDYQDAQAARKPIKVFNPATQREEYTNEGAVVRGQGPAQPQAMYTGPGYNGGSAAEAAKEQLLIMQAELNKLPPGHPDRPAVIREMQRLGAQPAQSGNYAAGPSAAELAANEAAKVRATDTAKADVVRDSARQADMKRFGQMNEGINRAIELLNQQPTASGIGSVVDKGLGAVGAATRGGELASRLETLSGWLVSNVPRMEGPQSDRDVQNYQAMAGTVGDRTKPIATRLAAAQEVQRLQQKYAALNGGTSSQDQPKQSESTQREFSMLPKAADFDGKRMRAPDGTIYRSSGGRWVKE